MDAGVKKAILSGFGRAGVKVLLYPTMLPVSSASSILASINHKKSNLSQPLQLCDANAYFLLQAVAHNSTVERHKVKNYSITSSPCCARRLTRVTPMGGEPKSEVGGFRRPLVTPTHALCALGSPTVITIGSNGQSQPRRNGWCTPDVIIRALPPGLTLSCS